MRIVLLWFTLTFLLSSLSTPEKAHYTVQIASYNNLQRAVVTGKTLEEKGLRNVYIETQWLDSTNRVYRIVVGNDQTRKNLDYTLTKVKGIGFDDAFIKTRNGRRSYTPVAKIKPESSQHPYNTLGYVQHGIASFYAHKFHSKYTSNGEVYDMDGISAAHNKIQFNSLVRVTNKKNGKQIIVRINDRGPFVKNRILDLSRGAARELGMVRDGIVPIELEVIRVGADGPRLSSVRAAHQDPTKKIHRTVTYDLMGLPRKVSQYGVQVASYDVLFKAVKLGETLKSKGYRKVFIQQGWTKSKQATFRVMVGDRSKYLARGDQRKLAEEYPECFVKPYFNF